MARCGAGETRSNDSRKAWSSLLFLTHVIYEIDLLYVLYIILTGLALCDVPDDILLGDSPRHWHRDSSQVPVVRCFLN